MPRAQDGGGGNTRKRRPGSRSNACTTAGMPPASPAPRGRSAAPRRIHERPLSQTVHGPDAVSGKSRTDRGGGGDDGGRAPASPPQGGDVSQVPLDDLDSVAAKEFLSCGSGTNEAAHGALGR